jgi:DNA-binding IclR family transcriptional regulator
MSSRDRSRTVDHALDVLEALQAGGGLIGVSDVARRLRLSKTVTHRLLSTLARTRPTTSARARVVPAVYWCVRRPGWL